MEYTILCRDKNTGEITKVCAGITKAEFLIMLNAVLEDRPLYMYDIDVSASMRLTVRETLDQNMLNGQQLDSIHDMLIEKLAIKIGVRK